MNEPRLTRTEITEKLTALDHSRALLKTGYLIDSGFWPAFAGEVSLIIGGVSAADFGWALKQIDAILAKHRLGPLNDPGLSADRRVSDGQGSDRQGGDRRAGDRRARRSVD